MQQSSIARFVGEGLLGLLLIAIFCGCESRLQRQFNYASKKTVVLFPIVNRTPGDVFQTDYLDERNLFDSLLDKLSDVDILLVYASATKAGAVNSIELSELEKGVVPDHLKYLGHDYSMVVSLDEFRAAGLSSIRRIKLSCIVVDNRGASVIWTSSKSDWRWRGILGGPLLEMLKRPDLDGVTLQYVNGLFAEEFREEAEIFIHTCPLFHQKAL